MQSELDKMEPATYEKALVSSLQKAWRQISSETLGSMACGMLGIFGG